MEWENADGVATLMVSIEAPLGTSINQLCERIKSDLIPENEGVSWDHLRLEIWGDSGRILVFPASTSQSDRIEKSVCQVVFEKLLGEYEELADSEVDDDEFTDRWKAITQSWAERVVEVAQSTELRGTRFIFWDAEDEQPIQDIVI